MAGSKFSGKALSWGDFMLTIQVCVGSSCFLRGAINVIAEFEGLISHYKMDDLVVLKGNFCLEHCNEGATVKIGDKIFTGVRCEDVSGLFDLEVIPSVYGVK